MTKPFLKLLLLTAFAFTCCKDLSSKEKRSPQRADSVDGKTQVVDDSLTVYQSTNLTIKRLSDHIYQHISFLNTDDYGKVECNGMLVVNENEAMVFDTPTDTKSSLELINFLKDELNTTITAIVPTHFHEDCVGGIKEFEKQHIPIYASKRTAVLVKENGQDFPKAMTTFDSYLTLAIGDKKVYAEYFGEGHTKDNVIGYFPESNAIFGGCLIKSLGANKGYLGDANTDQWAGTVQQIKLKYPNAEIVIPGHGKPGGTELLEYTIKLFEEK